MKLKVFAIVLGIAASLSAQSEKHIFPTVEGAKQLASPPANPTIIYHGGPVLGTVSGQPVNLYLIFYGGWSTLDPTGPKLMGEFASTLGGSGYWNILTTYKESNGTDIFNNLKLAGHTSDNYSQGKSLNDNTLQTVVQTAISNGSLPLDANGIYHVLTSSDVTETSGFCSAYCGFHNYMTYQNTVIKYTFIGNPAGCTQYGGVADCQGLSTNITASPNNDPGVDAMISVIAHESEEATSDPQLNAWFFNSGNENADQCAYTYGKTKILANGSAANIKLGNKAYLIQQDYVAPNLGCAMSH